MTNPQRFINRVILFLVLAAIVVAAIYDIVLRAFLHNPPLNGLIIAVLLLGIIYALRRIWMLRAEVRWIEEFRNGTPVNALGDPPKLLSPVASALGDEERQGRASFNAMSMRYLLDSISARLDESRDISRYQIGLLIFLGLLGTFWGLLETINAVANVISDLSLTNNDMVGMFDELKVGLAAPLSGMGTAFSSSLFGLAGSLVLGFIDLQATQAQNSFYNDMEEWLSGLTRLSSTEAPTMQLGEVSSSPPLPAYVQAMLHQTAENIDQLRQTVYRTEENRHQLAQAITQLNDRLGALGDHVQVQDQTLRQLIDAHERSFQPLLQGREGGGMLDEATRQHIRNTDVKLTQLIEEMARGREEATRELKSEIKLLSRTIAIAAGEPQSIRS